MIKYRKFYRTGLYSPEPYGPIRNFIRNVRHWILRDGRSRKA